MTLRNDTPAPPVAEMVPGDGELRCKIVTNMGEMTARLFEKEVPRTVANFVALALGKVEWTDPKGQKTSAPLYKDLVVHRVIPVPALVHLQGAKQGDVISVIQIQHGPGHISLGGLWWLEYLKGLLVTTLRIRGCGGWQIAQEGSATVKLCMSSYRK